MQQSASKPNAQGAEKATQNLSVDDLKAHASELKALVDATLVALTTDGAAVRRHGANYGETNAAPPAKNATAGVATDTPTVDHKADVTTAVVPTAIAKVLRMARPLAQNGKKRGVPMVITMRAACSFAYATSGGVISGVLPLDPSVNTAEWSAWQVLYDQYRVRDAHIRFHLMDATTITATNFGFVVAYDPTDNTALTGVREGCEYADHRLWVPNITGGTAGYGNALSEPFSYRPKMLGGVRVPTASVPTKDEWATTASPVPYGYIKSYGNGFSTNASGWVGIATYVVELRSRT